MEENQSTTDDVIVETPEATGAEDQNSTGDVTADHKEQSQDGDYFKNKAFEFERKYNNTAKELTEIKELIQNQQSGSKESYSEEQLKAALSSESLTPQQESFIKSELSKIESKKLEDRDKKIIDQIKKEQKDQLTRQQSEALVLGDNRFQEAFTTLPNGNKTWNEKSQLAQQMAAYMNDPRIKDQPDAMLVSAKLAYADISAHKAQSEAKSLKRQNEQLKNATMVEGGGKNFSQPSENPFNQHMDELKRGNKNSAKNAIKQYFKNRKASRK